MKHSHSVYQQQLALVQRLFIGYLLSKVEDKEAHNSLTREVQALERLTKRLGEE